MPKLPTISKSFSPGVANTALRKGVLSGVRGEVGQLVPKYGDDAVRAATSYLRPDEIPHKIPHIHGRKVADGVVETTFRDARGHLHHTNVSVKGKESLAAQFADGYERVETPVNMGLFGAQLGIPALAAAAVWTGNKTGMSALATGGNAMKAASGATFEQIGHKAPMLGSAAEAISKPAFGLMGAAVKPLEWLGITGGVSRYHGGKLDKHASALAATAQELLQHEATHPEVATAMGELKTAFGSGHHHQWDYAGISAAVDKTFEAAKEFQPDLAKLGSKMEKQALNAELAAHQMHGWKNLAANTAKAPEAIAKAGALHGALNATFVVGAAASGYKTTRDVYKATKSLAVMQANLTGQKPENVSTFNLMFGKVPEPVAVARGQLMREFGPAVMLDAFNTVLNIKFITHEKFWSKWMNMGLMMAVPMANQMLVRGMMHGELIQTYDQVKQKEAAGAPISPEDYGKLVGNASAELQQRGGGDSNFAKALGYIYSEEKMSMDDVLKEVDNGKLHLRIAKLQRDYDVLKESTHKDQLQQMHEGEKPTEAEEADVSDLPLSSPAHAHSHVDRLNGKAEDKEKAILGKHTEMVRRGGGETQLSV